MANYRQVANTSYVDNSINNGSFISRNDELDYSRNQADTVYDPNISGMGKPNPYEAMPWEMQESPLEYSSNQSPTTLGKNLQVQNQLPHNSNQWGQSNSINSNQQNLPKMQEQVGDFSLYAQRAANNMTQARQGFGTNVPMQNNQQTNQPQIYNSQQPNYNGAPANKQIPHSEQPQAQGLIKPRRVGLTTGNVPNNLGLNGPTHNQQGGVNHLNIEGNKVETRRNSQNPLMHDKRLTVLAQRRRSAFKPRLSVRKNMAGDTKKKDSVRENEISHTKRSLKVVDIIAAFLGVASGVIVYNENEIFYKEKIENGVIVKHQNQSDAVCTALRFINTIITVILTIMVIIHYVYKVRSLKLRNLIIQKEDLKSSTLFRPIIEFFRNLRSARLLIAFILEVTICVVFCPPYVDFSFRGTVLLGTYHYSLDAITSIVTLAKSYLILKLYSHFSPWTSERAAKVCAKHKCQANVLFAIKAELKKRPYIMLGILMFATIVYLGFAIRTFEISYVPSGQSSSFQFGFVLNAFWLTIITMTTVGFGEAYPATHLGRTIGVISCLIGMLLMSLMVVSLTVASEFTAEESKSFYILKRIYANDNAKEKAANVMKTVFRLRKTLKQRNAKKLVEKFVMLTKLKKQIGIFKNDYRIANAQNLPIDELLKNLQEKLENDIHDIKKEVMVIPEIDSRFSKLRDRQSKITGRLDEVLKMQTSIAEYLVRLNEVKNHR